MLQRAHPTLQKKMPMIRFVLLLLSTLLFSPTLSFEWAFSKPDVNRRAIAGLWKLTTGPLKEFTVYPKRPPTKPNELLLMLKEDGSFTKYNENSIDADWKALTKPRNVVDQLQYELHEGVWDYHEGRLILAADRAHRNNKDTLLSGRVVATYENKLQEQSLVEQEDAAKTSSLDAHLSVPKGNIKVGRFFYPKKHPSFFEQPMYQPQKRGAVRLQQVLGTLNTANDPDEPLVKFDRRDFYNKTFWLTSTPIGYHRKPTKEQRRTEASSQPTRHVRVLQVQFHANNTFSTLRGLGQDSILRGKFDVIGQDFDQLWMQVWRFGFGRSVSGSVYSEGRMLTHDDAKTYWGTISRNEDDQQQPLLQVKGSVMFGWGIEPIPEARFLLKEVEQEEEEAEEDEDDVIVRSIQQAFDQSNGVDPESGFQ